MKYEYTFTKIAPKQLFFTVKYSSGDLPDQFRNINTNDFSEENLKRLAESMVPSVIHTWNAIAEAPEDAPLEGVVISKTYKPSINLDEPSYNPETQKLEMVVTENETEIVTSWSIVELSAEEKESRLNGWRTYLSVTMRQARLALMQQGKLEDVQVALDALPEPQKSVAITEWEYATTVERNSPWVIQLGSALGLDEEGLDELFKAASLL